MLPKIKKKNSGKDFGFCDCSSPATGTDVMIVKVFSPKNLSKIFALFAQSAASFLQKL
jgi:hypothetical protein